MTIQRRNAHRGHAGYEVVTCVFVGFMLLIGFISGLRAGEGRGLALQITFGVVGSIVAFIGTTVGMFILVVVGLAIELLQQLYAWWRR